MSRCPLNFYREPFHKVSDCTTPNVSTKFYKFDVKENELKYNDKDQSGIKMIEFQ